MTTKEYITKSLSKFEISNDEIDLIIVENGLEESSSVNVRESKQAICKSIGAWLPVKASVSEGGVSMTWNLDAIKIYYSALCKELGVTDLSVPQVRDKSNLW